MRQLDTPKKHNRLLTYASTMLVAVVVLSLLTYLGPPFGPDWATIRDYLAGIME